MKERIVKLSRSAYRILCSDKIPVWLSLFLLLLGALATYWVAPAINQKFEMQAARREFLVSNMNYLSTASQSLIDSVGKLVNERRGPQFDSSLISLNGLISKLQLHAVQLMYVIPENRDSILRLQAALSSLQERILTFSPGGDPKEVIAATQEIGQLSLSLYQILLAHSGL